MRPVTWSRSWPRPGSQTREVGRGGFGVVYHCSQVRLARVVATKVLTNELDEDRARFVREQHAMGRLTGHPNIVPVLEVGETSGGHPYLVMPYYQAGCLQDRIRDVGPLPLEEVLRLGVKMAGALQAAHDLGVVHRDVKPGNIFMTDYGEPALGDFGIARVSGSFSTATSSFTGSPGFTAPELLDGSMPTVASDVYSLGATLFAALTGHAAFERRYGEQLVAHFLRIATDPVPDLRELGIDDGVAAVIDAAMAREPGNRPSVLELGAQLQDLQRSRGLAVDEMAVQASPQPTGLKNPASPSSSLRRSPTTLPTPRASFVGRAAEMEELRTALSESRLVTLTGVGGIGKTTLAIHAAREFAPEFSGGVWLVELAGLRDGALLTDVVATSLGVRDRLGQALHDVLVDFLANRRALVILDNCEHLIDDVTKLADALLQSCAQLRILATSREVLNLSWEMVMPLSPLAVPRTEEDPARAAPASYPQWSCSSSAPAPPCLDLL